MNETIRLKATHFNIYKPNEERPQWTFQFYDKKEKINVLVSFDEIDKFIESLNETKKRIK